MPSPERSASKRIAYDVAALNCKESLDVTQTPTDVSPTVGPACRAGLSGLPAPCVRDKPRPPAIINSLHTEFALWPCENPCRQKLLELLQSHVNARTPIRSRLPWPPYCRTCRSLVLRNLYRLCRVSSKQGFQRSDKGFKCWAMSTRRLVLWQFT